MPNNHCLEPLSIKSTGTAIWQSKVCCSSAEQQLHACEWSAPCLRNCCAFAVAAFTRWALLSKLRRAAQNLPAPERHLHHQGTEKIHDTDSTCTGTQIRVVLLLLLTTSGQKANDAHACMHAHPPGALCCVAPAHTKLGTRQPRQCQATQEHNRAGPRLGAFCVAATDLSVDMQLGKLCVVVASIQHCFASAGVS